MPDQLKNNIKVLLRPFAAQLASGLYNLANWIVWHTLPVTDVEKLHMNGDISDEEWEAIRETFE